HRRHARDGLAPAAVPGHAPVRPDLSDRDAHGAAGFSAAAARAGLRARSDLPARAGHAARLASRGAARSGLRRLAAPGEAVSRPPLPNGLAALAALAVLVIAGVGHVGSPDVYFRGAAGPYDVGVVIRPPGVVPGQLDVVVQVSNEPAAQVTVQPVLWETGADGAPPPDLAAPVPGEAGAFATRLWLMTSGSYSIRVVVS